MFLVDSADFERFAESKAELDALLAGLPLRLVGEDRGFGLNIVIGRVLIEREEVFAALICDRLKKVYAAGVFDVEVEVVDFY